MLEWSAALSSPSPTRPASSTSRAARRARRRAPLHRRHAKALADAGLPVVDGRRLHRLARDPRRAREDAAPARPRRHPRPARPRADEADVEAHGIPPIDLVVVNLYPFARRSRPGRRFESCVENIDIGGPAMVRAPPRTTRTSRSSSTRATTSACSPSSRRRGALVRRDALRALAQGLRAHRRLRRGHLRVPDSRASRRRAARRGSRRRSRAVYAQGAATCATARTRTRRPRSTARGREPDEPTRRLAQVLQGKELCYNNLLDLDAALARRARVRRRRPPRRHQAHQPLRRGRGRDARPRPTHGARDGDPVSAFGGIVALNRAGRRRGRGGARPRPLLECVIAPDYDEAARAVARARRRTCACSSAAPASRRDWRAAGAARAALDRRRPAGAGPRPRRRSRREDCKVDDEARADRRGAGRTCSSPGRSPST